MFPLRLKTFISIALVVFTAFSTTGCQLIEEVEVETVKKPPKVIPSIQNARSIAEIDHALEKIIQGKDAQIKVETLLNGWGRFGDWYDLAVVKYLWEHWPSYSSDRNVDSERLLPIVITRIEDQPELNRQVYWYTQWKYGVWDFARLCKQVSNTVAHRMIEGEEFHRIMYIASVTNQPNKVLVVDWENLFPLWHFSSLQFLALRPFLRYDDELGHYVIDETASKEHRYLDASKQKATPRKTPLPGWSHPVVPSPPHTDTMCLYCWTKPKGTK